MIKLRNLFEQDTPLDPVNAIHNSIENPSYSPNENEYINDYVKAIKQLHPNGVTAIETYEDLQNADASIQLKVLLALAKNKLLNFGSVSGGWKLTPQEVLKIYGNPKHTAEEEPVYSLNEYSDKLINTMVDLYKSQTKDNEEQIKQNIKRFEQLTNSIAAKLQQKNPAVLHAVPDDLQQNNKFRDITQYKDYNVLTRVLKSVEKKSVDVYKQAIEFYKKQNQYINPTIIGNYVARFKQNLKDLVEKVESKDRDALNLIPKELLKNNAYQNILSWKDFEKLEHMLDGLFPLENTGGDDENDASTDADILYNKGGIEIYKGDEEHKCIRYSKGYSWCIGRGMYANYRYLQQNADQNRMFYFVFDRNKSKDDPYHVVVIHVNARGKYTRTTSLNNGDEPYGGTDWEDLGKYFKGKEGQDLWNKIKGLKSLFKFIQPNKGEQKRIGFRGQRKTLEQFIDMDSEDKQDWLRANAADRSIITTEIVNSLDNEQKNDLINYDRKFSYNELENSKPLLKRYADYRYTHYPKEPLPYPFIPFLKPILQEKYFKEFEKKYITFEILEKYFDENITKQYIEQQISKLGYLPKEAEKYMNPKQKTLYNAYSIAQSQFVGKATYKEGKNIIDTVEAPNQTFVLNTPSADYLSKLQPQQLNSFNELVEKVTPDEKYIEFIFGVPTCFKYNNKLYYYTPRHKSKDNDEKDHETEWCIIDQDGKIVIDKLLNKDEEGLKFYIKGQEYEHTLIYAGYYVGSSHIYLEAGKDFDEIHLKDMNEKLTKYKIDQLSKILKESIYDDWFKYKMKLRAGII